MDNIDVDIDIEINPHHPDTSESITSNLTKCSTEEYHSEVETSHLSGSDTDSMVELESDSDSTSDNTKESESSESEHSYSYHSGTQSSNNSIYITSEDESSIYNLDSPKQQTIKELVNDGVDHTDEMITNSIHNLTYTPDAEPGSNPTIENQNKNPDNELRIVACLTCNYEGLQYIKKTLISLHDQEFDCIYLNVPGHYFSNSRDLIPEWMKICCEVIFCQNLGPIIKLLPILERETNPNTIIVSVENGVIYPKNMAKTFLQIFRKNQHSVYALNVYKFKSINYFQPITINNNVGDIFDGINGVGYLRGFFRSDLNTYISILSKYEACIYSDYLIISNYLHKYKISIRCLNRKNYNINLVQPILKKESLYTSSGLNFKIVFKYYKVIQILVNYHLMYFKNPKSILDALHYLATRPYNVAFN